MATPVSGTREWAVAEINCSVGCPHDCRYCYARVAALKRGAITTPEQWTQSRVVPELVEIVHTRYPGQVMFPTAHDIIDANLNASLKVIDGLLAAGNQVLIVSKPSPACIERICDRCAGAREHILFRFTITARDSDILSFWEPGAPSYRERMQALALAFEKGFATSVSIEPMLDIYDVEELVAELSPSVTHSIWIGTMNKIDERVRISCDKTAAEVARIKSEQTDERVRELFDALREYPLIRWKESIKRVVGIELLSESGLDR